MSRKEIWKNGLKRHGKVKVYAYIACLPVMLPLYGFAIILVCIGAIGEIIINKLENI